MHQIADWLEKLGLSEYTARFAENGIDISVLRYLTEADAARRQTSAALRQGASAPSAEAGLASLT